mmetsp:Transcript_22961/g.42636  ORF Transcript_22961/g.42636 Transcript_22961/m.42636 type:complete len:212 (-) Transcript_22961:24-659(-)
MFDKHGSSSGISLTSGARLLKSPFTMSMSRSMIAVVIRYPVPWVMPFHHLNLNVGPCYSGFGCCCCCSSSTSFVVVLTKLQPRRTSAVGRSQFIKKGRFQVRGNDTNFASWCTVETCVGRRLLSPYGLLMNRPSCPRKVLNRSHVHVVGPGTFIGRNAHSNGLSQKDGFRIVHLLLAFVTNVSHQIVQCRRIDRIIGSICDGSFRRQLSVL